MDPNAIAALRAALLRMYPGAVAGNSTMPVSPQQQNARAQANTAQAFGFNDIQRATGLNLDPNVGISGLWQPQIPPERRIQEDFRQFPGYY